MRFSHLAIDKPLLDASCWYRFLTNTDHVTKDRTVHYQALKGAQFTSSTGKPWDHELSGAVVGAPDSAEQIRVSGEAKVEAARQKFVARGAKVPSKIQFAGIAHAEGIELRNTIEGIRTDTAYTPLTDNRSHSDFVTFHSTSDFSLDPVRYWLIKTLQVISPSEVEKIAPKLAEKSPSDKERFGDKD